MVPIVFYSFLHFTVPFHPLSFLSFLKPRFHSIKFIVFLCELSRWNKLSANLSDINSTMPADKFHPVFFWLSIYFNYFQFFHAYIFVVVYFSLFFCHFFFFLFYSRYGRHFSDPLPITFRSLSSYQTPSTFILFFSSSL